MSGKNLAQLVMRRIEALGKISDEPGFLTRTFCSPAMRRTNDLVSSWMHEAGMNAREDAVGNLIGHYPANQPHARTLLLGSHLDTVRDAGKFDGPLGVLVAIACVQKLNETKARLPFAIEVVGFADEEGVRYQSTYLGSKAIAGTFNTNDLKRTDANGVTMAEAIRKFGGNPNALKSAKLDPKKILGYAEVHIEQGPVLEQKKMAVGVVTAIAGQTRVRLNFLGRAGHAGTTPMHLRRDALCAATEFILATEKFAKKKAGLVATVGEIFALPGASNVIPGEARLSLDIRHAKDSVRQLAVRALKKTAGEIAQQRKAQVGWQVVHQAPAVACAEKLSALLGQAVANRQKKLVQLPSGAGHDAVTMAAITPVAMLFVRCKGGVSHHPDESATVGDVRAAIAVMDEFLQLLAGQYERV